MRTLVTLLALPNHELLRPIEVARLTGISRQGVDYAIKSRLLPSEFSGRHTCVRKAAALLYQTKNKWTGRRGRHLLPVPKVCGHCGKVFTGIKKARYCSRRCFSARYQQDISTQSPGQGKPAVVPSAPET